jgi:hypothetical protein
MDPLSRSLLVDLVSATEQGDAERVRDLLSIGVPPDVIDIESRWSALHASVIHNPMLLATLLGHTRNPDGPRVLGGTPLSYAVHELGEKPNPERKQQLLRAIELLLQSGADPTCGASDQSALELSRLYGMPDVEALLVQPETKG